MKPLSLIAITLSSALWIGCNTGSNTHHSHESADTTTHQDGAVHAGGHLYSCPMHPEVTSTSPGKCSKCGMTLEHTDQAGNNRKYRMDFVAAPAQIEAGKPTALSFTPKDEADANAMIPLEVVHEKKMHLIIVSKDLSYFSHEHPEYRADGQYVWEHAFPTGGEYLLFQDFMPKGASHQLSRIPVKVVGQQRQAVKYTAENLVWKEDDYQVTLGFDKLPLQSKQPVVVKITVSKAGQPITNLDNYLGALGHMVIISEDTQDYLHVHPQESATKGPEVNFNSGFEKPGIYRVFLQFNHEGKIRTANFTIKVEGSPSNA